jgi:hypothetical protein
MNCTSIEQELQLHCVMQCFGQHNVTNRCLKPYSDGH